MVFGTSFASHASPSAIEPSFAIELRVVDDVIDTARGALKLRAIPTVDVVEEHERIVLRRVATS